LVPDESGDHLRNEVARRLLGDERVEHDPVGTAIRREYEIRTVVVARAECRGSRCLVRAIRDGPCNRAVDRGVTDDGPQPRERVEWEAGIRSVQRLGLRGIATARPVANAERVRTDRMAFLLAPVA